MAVDRKQQMKEITERLEQGVKDIFTCALSCKAQSLNCCTIRSSLKTVQRNAPKNPAQSKTTI